MDVDTEEDEVTEGSITLKMERQYERLCSVLREKDENILRLELEIKNLQNRNPHSLDQEETIAQLKGNLNNLKDENSKLHNLLQLSQNERDVAARKLNTICRKSQVLLGKCNSIEEEIMQLDQKNKDFEISTRVLSKSKEDVHSTSAELIHCIESSENRHHDLGEHIQHAVEEQLGRLVCDLLLCITDNPFKLTADELCGISNMAELGQMSKSELIREIVNKLSHTIVDRQTALSELEAKFATFKKGEGDGKLEMLKSEMKQLEERYEKLRGITMKYKQQNASLNAELEQERSQVLAYKTELASYSTTTSNQAKLSKHLQSECDRLADTLELKENEIKEMKKIIHGQDQTVADLDSQIARIQSDVLAVKEERDTFERETTDLKTSVKDITSKLEDFKKEKMAYDLIRQKEEDDKRCLKQKLKETEENLNRLQGSINEVQLNARKQNAVDLEIRDYEKAIEDLNGQLKNEKCKVEDMSEKINVYSDSNNSLIEKLKQLEEQLIASTDQIEKMNEQIVSLNKKIAEQQSAIQERETSLMDMRRNYKNQVEDTENITKQFEKLSQQHEDLVKKYSEQQDIFSRQMNMLRMELTASQDALRSEESEKDRLKNEFEAYKIRAHNTLQKHRLDNPYKDTEAKLKQDLETLRKNVHSLENQLNNTRQELEKLKIGYSMVEAEKVDLDRNSKELKQLLMDKSNHIDVLEKELKNIRTCYKIEMSKNQSCETKLNVYGEEIADLRLNLADISSEVESLRRQNRLYLEQQNYLKSASIRKESDKISENEEIMKKENNFDAYSQKSEESIRSKKPLSSLEELLSLERNSIEFSSQDDNAYVLELKRKLTNYEDQIRNLTSVINEHEKNASHNEVQLSFLKDEVRRLTRTVEREPHLKNTEYLKNVLIKFITLQKGDERTRLVPVLETMLQLSPEESKQLQDLARDGDIDSQNSWGSILSWR